MTSTQIDQAKGQLAGFRAQLANETAPMRRAALLNKIKALSGKIAHAEYVAKSAPLRQAMAGAY